MAKYIKTFLDDCKMYEKMWPHNENIPKVILHRLKDFIKKEEVRFRTIPNYFPPAQEDIGNLFGIKRKTVENYAQRFISEKELYAKMWTIRSGRPARNYKKQLKKLIYDKVKQDNIHPSQIIPEEFLHQIGNQYKNDENILLVVKYIYIIYFLTHTQLSTYKIGKYFSPIFNQSPASLRSMALKISLLLEREFTDYEYKSREEKDTFFEVSQMEIRKIKKYRRSKSKEELQKFFQDFETEIENEEVFRPRCKLSEKITSNEFRSIKQRLKEHKAVQGIKFKYSL